MYILIKRNFLKSISTLGKEFAIEIRTAVIFTISENSLKVTRSTQPTHSIRPINEFALRVREEHENLISRAWKIILA